MNENSAQKLFDTLKTKRRVNDFLRLYNSFMGFSHHIEDVDVEGILSSVFGENRPDWVSNLGSCIPGFQSSKLNEDDVKILELVKDLIDKAVSVKIEVSFEPSNGFIEGVINILKSNYDSKNFIVDTVVKEDAEPGASVYMEGKFIDLTVRNRVINYLSSQNVVNRYL